ncbi:MAG: acetoacetate--CoA ligase [Burkholderiaceae bacterium]|nr:acetoacetate--CoA ligase [Burkholderiaceae bacterium]
MPEEDSAPCQMAAYQDWLAARHGLRFDDYESLHRWSVTELDAFWGSIREYFQLIDEGDPQPVLAAERMPGAVWFPGLKLNYVDQVLRHAGVGDPQRPAIVHRSETGRAGEIAWAQLRDRVAALATRLVELGIEPGDRVAAYLPNIPDTVVAFLATASVGGVWSLCSPDMGPVGVLDRFRQIEPKLLVTCDGYVYGGKPQDRMDVVGEMLAELPSVRHVLALPYLDPARPLAAFATDRPVHDLRAACEAPAPAGWAPLRLPFDAPLWIVYSSGTTGMPKPIVHGHGGVLLEHLKLGVLHNDVGPDDRFHWYSSTGWVMWNLHVSGLLGGTTICIYDGNPGWPDMGTLWRFAAQAGVSFFGAGAAYYASCVKAGVRPADYGDLSRLRALGSTGSPLSAESYEWGWQEFGRDLWWCVISGGTDFAGAFIGGNRLLSTTPGEMQCRCLGAAVEAWSEDGKPLIDEVGELVCVRPMPSMPLRLWGDEDGSRYHDSYFDMYPGTWRHGDWIRITPSGGSIIYGRSDATINRFGIRMGTAELYRAVETIPAVIDSLVVDLEYLGRDSYMPLFVVLREGAVLDEALLGQINSRIRTAMSPRHLPSEVIVAPEIPRTLSGKKLELPVKKLLMGVAPEKALNRDAMANPASIDWYIEFARRRATASDPS